MVKNIILVSVDDLRYDCVGYQPDKRELVKYDVLKYLETPTLDGVAEQSICFTQCISTNTYTTASHASIFTGLYPPRHGVRAFYETKLSSEVNTLAEVLKVFGYKTVFMCCAPVNFLPLNLHRGFDHVFINDDAGIMDFLEKNAGGKIFLFVHFFDVHEPYLFAKHPGFDNSDYFSVLQSLSEKCNISLQGQKDDGWSPWGHLVKAIGRKTEILLPLYVKGVSKFDKNRLANFTNNLGRIGLLDEGLLILFSDHGEGKMYHDQPEMFGHGGGVFDNVIRVPLLIRHRDLPHETRNNLVSLVDIFPTVTALALGRDAQDLLPYPLDGHSLLDPQGHEEVYCEKWLANNTPDHPLNQISFFLWQRAVRTENKKFIVYGEPEFFMERDIDGMKNSEFLKSVYRKLLCTFEDYDEYMMQLGMLNTGKLTKKDLLDRYRNGRVELYDVEKDPYEENPLRVHEAPAFSSLMRAKAIELNALSVKPEYIFEPISKNLAGGLVKRLILDEQEVPLDVVVDNKNLCNGLIKKFFERHKDIMPDREFMKKCFSVFFDREPDDRDWNEIATALGRGDSRDAVFETYFVNKVFRAPDHFSERSSGSPDELGGSVQISEGNEDRIEQLLSEVSQKDAKIRACEHSINELRLRLDRADETLARVLNSKTWRIGQIYGKSLGAESRWRKWITNLLGKE